MHILHSTRAQQHISRKGSPWTNLLEVRVHTQGVEDICLCQGSKDEIWKMTTTTRFGIKVAQCFPVHVLLIIGLIHSNQISNRALQSTSLIILAHFDRPRPCLFPICMLMLDAFLKKSPTNCAVCQSLQSQHANITQRRSRGLGHHPNVFIQLPLESTGLGSCR